MVCAHTQVPDALHNLLLLMQPSTMFNSSFLRSDDFVGCRHSDADHTSVLDTMQVVTKYGKIKCSKMIPKDTPCVSMMSGKRTNLVAVETLDGLKKILQNHPLKEIRAEFISRSGMDMEPVAKRARHCRTQNATVAVGTLDEGGNADRALAP